MLRDLAAATVFLMAFGVTPVQAQNPNQGWTLCTAGALNACSSIQIQTVQSMGQGAYCPFGSPTDANGIPYCSLTELTITARNLQGSLAQDNTWISAITGIQFDAAADVGNTFDFSTRTLTGPVGGSISGGGPGPTTFGAGGVYSAGPGNVTWDNTDRDGWGTYISGCNAPVATTAPVPGAIGTFNQIAQTCDPLGYTGAITFTAQFDRFWSAADITQVHVSGIAFQNPGDLTSTAWTCSSGDPSGCIAVVPEPETVALLGTGLLALLGVGLIRRRQEHA